MTRIFLPIAFLLYLCVALLLPAIRLHRTTGRWGIVAFDRGGGTSRRVVSLLIAICGAAVILWIALYTFLKLAVWPATAWVTAIGWACAVAGTIVTVTAQAQMGGSWRVGIDEEPTELVTSGLFAYSRNPIFSGVLLAMFGVLLLTPSPWTIGITLSFALTLQLQTRLEERHLSRLHGQPYLDYASKVGRFLPGDRSAVTSVAAIGSVLAAASCCLPILPFCLRRRRRGQFRVPYCFAALPFRRCWRMRWRTCWPGESHEPKTDRPDCSRVGFGGGLYYFLWRAPDTRGTAASRRSESPELLDHREHLQWSQGRCSHPRAALPHLNVLPAGAPAAGRLFKEFSGKGIRVWVVWEPVLPVLAAPRP